MCSCMGYYVLSFVRVCVRISVCSCMCLYNRTLKFVCECRLFYRFFVRACVHAYLFVYIHACVSVRV